MNRTTVLLLIHPPTAKSVVLYGGDAEVARRASHKYILFLVIRDLQPSSCILAKHLMGGN